MNYKLLDCSLVYLEFYCVNKLIEQIFSFLLLLCEKYVNVKVFVHVTPINSEGLLTLWNFNLKSL